MEQQPKRDMQSSNPRRRTRSKIQNFKEAYLPFLIFIAGVALIIGIVVGIVSCTRDPGPSTDPSGETCCGKKRLRCWKMPSNWLWPMTLMVRLVF